MKILILGGYGIFGGRLAHLLADCPSLEILIGGRDPAKATGFCQGWTGTAKIRPIACDRATIARALAAETPDLLVDTSGPFQSYGTDPYGVIKACLAARVPYLDLADGADFVAGVPSFDTEAKAAGIFILSGVSSFPVLTAAVIAEAAKTMTPAKVTAGIAPSPHAIVGMNVLRAILGYAGGEVALIRDGKPAMAHGLTETRRYTIAPPGKLPLNNTLFSLVDVPDLRSIPAAMPEVKTLWVGAGPTPEVLHRALILLARLRAALRLPPFTRLAPLCQTALTRLRHGEHRGGMFVEIEGTTDAIPVTRSWHLLAEGEDGPLIPSMACEALIRRCLNGDPPQPGARSGIGALSLADYDALFRSRTITTGWRDTPSGPLYRRILGTAFDRLPPSLQRLHQPGAQAQWSGLASVQRGTSRLAALISRLFGFPGAGDVAVTVTFRTDAKGRETWTRNFSSRLMVSTQEPGTRRNTHLITERFGPFAFGLALVLDGAVLRLIPRRWTLFGLPLPRALMPQGDSYETERDGKFRFHVEIALPLIGPVVTYDGWLDPAG